MAGNDDYRLLEAYLNEVRYWMPLDDLSRVRKELGSANDILEHHDRVRALLAADERRKAVWSAVTRAGGAFVAFLLAIQVIKSLVPAELWPW